MQHDHTLKMLKGFNTFAKLRKNMAFVLALKWEDVIPTTKMMRMMKMMKMMKMTKMKMKTENVSTMSLYFI